jgi:hypothetical protein
LKRTEIPDFQGRKAQQNIIMNDKQRLKNDYPWIQTPVVVGAPMRLIALADMAVEISKAGAHALMSTPSQRRVFALHLSQLQTWHLTLHINNTL